MLVQCNGIEYAPYSRMFPCVWDERRALAQLSAEAMQIMRQDWKPGMKLQEALDLTAKVLVKTMDTASPTAEPW